MAGGQLERLFARRHDVVMFVPQQRRYSSGMTFALAELLPTPAGGRSRRRRRGRRRLRSRSTR
ncbi:hypothetical protein OV079_53290 [Nannocystis pusilla]|uniref:Uncharacterized protein n=1 Tax=Nannocystis pusilla TaxID=889268 RepID=A0A9X3FA10_9BACT|nr:hypothetical protein [Nannocystis pusilla]MCY1014151.1 hypothetical protein [Nannocystis pusilla]